MRTQFLNARKLLCFMLILLMTFTLIGCTPKKENEISNDEIKENTTQDNKKDDASDKKSDKIFRVEIIKGNSWESDGKYCAQYDGTIYNYGSDVTQDWIVSFNVPNDTNISSFWNGEFELHKDTLTINAVDYNKEIQANGNTTFGFILETPQEGFQVEDITLLINGEDASEFITSNKDKESEKTEVTTEDKIDEKTNIAKKDTSGTPVANHGELQVKGTNIVDKKGEVYQLKGVSTHGIGWFPEYVNEDAFKTFRDDWGANVIRLAMYTGEGQGYITGGDKTKLKELVNNGVEYATNLGMYVIIDWHILQDNNPLTNKDESIAFFEDMSKKYKDYDNVIYEICNEPNSGTTWSDVKSYAEDVIPVIKKNNKDAIIIVGTPTWSQDVDVASKDQITGYSNIMYAAHFYAATHKEDLRNKIKTALDNGAPIFISECSICDASGNGNIDYNEAEAWMDFINENNMSFICWNVSNKDESSSLIKSGCSSTSNWSDDDYSDTGVWFKEQINK